MLGGLEERSRETGSKQRDQKTGAKGFRRRSKWGWIALEEARTEEQMTALWDCTGVPWALLRAEKAVEVSEQGSGQI